MSEQKPINVAILDDDREYRALLAGILDASQGFKCVGAYKNCEEAVRKIETDLPDVLLLDIEMPVKSGIDSLKILKFHFPTVKVLMLTVYSDNEKIFQSLRAGAVGYLLKKSPKEKLLEAIRDAFEGGAPFSGEVAQKVLRYFQNPTGHSDFTVLSDREKQVLEDLIERHGTKVISDRLFVSTHTVRFHLHNIYVKLHVNSRSEAIAKALKNKIR